MSSGSGALLLAMPGESIDDLIGRLERMGSFGAQVLIPDGVTILHQAGAAERLAAAARARSIDLVVISSDQITLSALREAGLVAVAVEGAAVSSPSTPRPPRPRVARPQADYNDLGMLASLLAADNVSPVAAAPAPAAAPPAPPTQRLPETTAPAPAAPVVATPAAAAPAPAAPVVATPAAAAPPVAPAPAAPADPGDPYATGPSDPRGRPAAPLEDDDAAILAALDDFDALTPAPTIDPGDPYATDPGDPYAMGMGDPRARLAAPADPGDPRGAVPYDPFDDLSETFASEAEQRRGAAPARDAAFADDLDGWGAPRAAAPAYQEPPRARVRPEDIELSTAEQVRASRTNAYTPPRARPVAPAPSYSDEPTLAPVRRGLSIPLLVASLLLLLVVIGAVLIFSQRTTIVVEPPRRDLGEVAVNNFAIPLAPLGAGATDSAVIADTVAVEARYQVQGTVTSGTSAPAASASGAIIISSLNSQPISFPAGTEFIAFKGDGQEVRFVTNEPINVPPASTIDQGNQIVTTRGQAVVGVVARAPGSTSNVDANTIVRMVIPNQGEIDVTGGNLVVRHDPIGGGSEQEIRIVKPEDVQAVLGEALAGLNNQARSDLAAAGATLGAAQIEPTTIFPREADLSQLNGVTIIVTPPEGQPVDPANPVFTVEVQARFSALATPTDKPLGNQLQAVFPDQLATAGMLSLGDCRIAQVTGWRWDGQLLGADGAVVPNTQDGNCREGVLSDQALNQVLEAVLGKPRDEAAAALNELIERGVISAYRLPEVETFPGWRTQVQIDVGEAAQ